MVRICTFLSLILILFISSCDLFRVPEDNTGNERDTSGIALFNFDMPPLYGDPLTYDIRYPLRIDRDIHRYHLNIYEKAEDTLNGNYVKCAGLSRTKQFYEFNLKPGKYFYEAALICTAHPSQCEFVGFDVDNMLWSYGAFEAVKDSTVEVDIRFIVTF